MAVNEYYVSRDGNMALSANFTVREFACNDGTDRVLIDSDLVNFLQRIRSALGAAVTITSGYRTAAYNASVGGESGSYHVLGKAADIVVAGKTTSEVARCAESLGMKGIIRYITDNFVHVDTRTDKYYATVTTQNGQRYYTTVSTHDTVNDTTVSDVQRRLNQWYSAGLNVDGAYGAGTKRALIRALQIELNNAYSANLTTDGYWGAATKAACRTVTGGTGNIQYIVQAGLLCIGYTNMVADRNYGQSTINIVKQFQNARGLSPDGQFGKECFAALFG